MSQLISVPAGARFSCQSCGQCCQGWAVSVDQATVDRLRAHDWGGEPFEPATTPGEPFRTRLVDRRCFFLDKENRCRIHTEMSYEDKPAVCKAFPLAVLEVAGKRYARMSYWCPTVTANAGKPLDHQMRWLNETARHTDHRTAPLMINDKTEIGVPDFERVHQIVHRILSDSALPVGSRLAAASTVVRRLDTAAEKDPGVAVDAVLRLAASEGTAALAVEARRGGHPSAGRRLLSLYLLQDRRGSTLAHVRRLASVVLFSVGITRLRTHAVPARASWSQMRRVRFEPSASSDELLTRYLCSKLDSRRYVAGTATLVTGLNLLVAAYGVINVLARMRAAADGRPSCDDEDIRLSVKAADLLVVEHAGLYQGGFYKTLTDAALGSSDLCGDLLARLEG